MHSRPSLSCRTVALAIAALGVSSCVDDHDHADATPAAEACEHLTDGPAEQVTASSASETATLANVSKPHTRFDIALPEVATGTYGGGVKYLSAKAGSALLLANADAPVQVLDSLGAAVTPTSVAATPACGTAKVQLALPLQVGTYRIQLGPTTVSNVGLLVEAP